MPLQLKRPFSGWRMRLFDGLSLEAVHHEALNKVGRLEHWQIDLQLTGVTTFRKLRWIFGTQ